MTDLDLRERSELCDLLVSLGPAAPTLCEGWTTADMAAHLAIRERDPRSIPGILFGGRFEGYTNRLMKKEATRGFDAVVARVRTPVAGPLSIPAVRRAISLVEYVVHHEDVRRANGAVPRTDRPDLQAGVWAMIGRLGRLMVARAKTGRSIQLVATGTTSGTHTFGKGPVVEITGEPIELLLYLYGRKGAAVVGRSGAAEDLAAVDAANFGI